MKKFFSIIMMAMMVFASFAEDKDDEKAKAAQAVIDIFNAKSWVFVAESANLANSVAVDRMSKQNNYFSCKGDLIYVKIDFIGADVRNTGLTPHKVGRLANEMRATGNSLATLPPMYEATYKITSMEVTKDKKGKHVTAKIKYTVEESNTTDIGSTPELVINIAVKDMTGNASFQGFRPDETYYGNFFENVKVL